MTSRITVAVLSLLIGPTALGQSWKEVRHDGPLIGGSASARIIESCRSGGFMSDARQCDYAFVDHHGNYVDIRRDIRDVTDEYLAKLPAVTPWVKEKQTYGYGIAKTSKPFPFRIHILTISPVVVLAVPSTEREPSCSGPEIFSLGCWPAARFDRVPYWYKKDAKVHEGSFWFEPQSKGKDVNYLPDGVTRHQIPLGDSILILQTKESGTWEVQRKANVSR